MRTLNPVGPSARRTVSPLAAAIAMLAVLLAGCGSDGAGSDGTAGRPGDGRDEVRSVPAEYPTIQDAVAAAKPGDLVLISPGTYHEEVVVGTERIVVRGTDRNRVVLDGNGRLIDGIKVTADQVSIENLTVRDYAVNGVLFAAPYGGDGPQEGPVGWRASYVTTHANGLYGLYAFGTGAGRFDHNYASGHPDSGIYVGQCQDCGALVIDNIAERNAIGYENTNASGVIVARNIFRSNRVGMTIASGRQELLAPQDGGQIVANLVADNDDPQTPETEGGFGVGIALAGGQGNVVERNVVKGHPGAGIVLIDQDGYPAERNQVTDNVLTDNAVDLVAAAADRGVPEVTGSCFSSNHPTSTAPPGLEGLLACGGPMQALPATALALAEAPPGVPPSEVAEPEDQPEMPGADATVAGQKWNAPDREAEKLDLATVKVPEGS